MKILLRVIVVEDGEIVGVIRGYTVKESDAGATNCGVKGEIVNVTLDVWPVEPVLIADRLIVLVAESLIVQLQFGMDDVKKPLLRPATILNACVAAWFVEMLIVTVCPDTTRPEIDEVTVRVPRGRTVNVRVTFGT